MRRSDGTTSAAMRIVKLPLISADMVVKPASEDDADKKAADVVYHNLMQIGWKQFLKEALLMLDFGFSLFEKVYDVIPYDEGDYIGIMYAESRKQTTILKWQMENGEPGVTQTNPNGGENISIPREALILFTNDQEGNNYEGRSLLRAAYKHWYIKESLYKIDAMGHEKQGLGVPKLTVPSDANEADKEKARQIVKNMRANEASYVELPEGFELEFMDMKSSSTRDPIPSINHHTTQIMKSVLAQFIELGSNTSNSGSNALSTDHSALFMKSETALAAQIAEVLEEQFIPDIMNFNFPNLKEYPTIEFSNLADTDLTALANNIQKMFASHAITPDPELEKYLRKIFSLPDLPDYIADNYDERITSPAVQPTTETPPTTQAKKFSIKATLKQLDKFIERQASAKPKRRNPFKR